MRGPTLPSPGDRHRPGEGARPRRDLADGDTARVPHHGLRAIPLPGAETQPGGPQESEVDRAQGDQVPPEGGRARLQLQEAAHRTHRGRRRQGEGHNLLPGARDGASGHRATHPRATR